MTKQEHELMILMFARLNERIGVVIDALKSREVVTADDVPAFSHAARMDDQKMHLYVELARRDYIEFAALCGVEPPSA